MAEKVYHPPVTARSGFPWLRLLVLLGIIAVALGGLVLAGKAGMESGHLRGLSLLLDRSDKPATRPVYQAQPVAGQEGARATAIEVETLILLVRTNALITCDSAFQPTLSGNLTGFRACLHTFSLEMCPRYFQAVEQLARCVYPRPPEAVSNDAPVS